MHCELCYKEPITSHHKCSGCGKWVGRCCLSPESPAPGANICRVCAVQSAEQQHYDNFRLGW